MTSNLDITMYDFEYICRTCLSREDLQPLYGNCNWSTCVVDMLLSCTFVKFTEGDGLPMNICTNCIHEIDKAFSFAKRCETTDTILRKCVKKFETELVNNSSQSVEPTIKANEEIILTNVPQTVEEVLKEEVKIEIKPEIILGDYEFVGTFKHEEELIIENKCDENYDDLVDENYEDDDEDKNQTNSEESDNAGYNLRCSSNDEDRFLPAKTPNKIRSSDFQCTICDRTFTEKKFLQRHTLIHKKKKFLCSLCKRSFVSKDLFNSHSKIHSVRAYACRVCGKAFSNSSNLKRHEPIHTGEKHHVCSICSKVFTVSQSLNDHMKRHTVDKRHSCEVCGKSFISIGELTRHKRIHTGEKPNVCSFCSKGFTQSSSLKIHMRIHSAEKPYSCEICVKGFSKKRYLADHKRKFHNVVN